MRRIAPLILVAGVAAGWTGCQSATEPDSAVAKSEAPGATSDWTLVTLKVPNMV